MAVEVLDEKDNVIPTADLPVTFQLSGAGELAGVGNANPTDISSFQQPRKSTFRGRCLAIVRPKGVTGTITLKASSPNLKSGELMIIVR